ncbi:hypothetical protein PCANC_00044 [Puccinia coronata f. sp. avenae]|uniref:AB hydrolase-1 domain-containing protein n=1 Tax=Puccinia coronata f. sp. avenae TaxID=200324 RepID=A0A2N5W8E1_9BASI|nr:hypothetical protein PCANC_00044 [Puccinia coronata f. sp. avenae]
MLHSTATPPTAGNNNNNKIITPDTLNWAHFSPVLQSATTHLLLKPLLLYFQCSPLLNYIGIAVILSVLQTHPDPTSNYVLYCALGYLTIELLFHLLFLHRYHRISHQQNKIIPTSIPKPSLRRNILDALISSFQSTNELTNALSSWFYYNHPQQHDAHHQPASAPVVSLHHIHYQNVAQLLASLFFSAHFHALTCTHQAEIHQDILRIQRAANHVFAPGLNPCLASYQHTLDPIQAQHRPLVFYLVIEACRHLLHLLLNFVGFRQYHIPINQTLFSYWFHPGFASHSPDQKEPPIVLVAGIVGLISLPHYAIYLLWKSPRPIFLVGNLSVSLTLFKPELHLIPVVVEEDESFMRRGDGTKTRRVVYRRKIQTLAEQSACLQKMLHRHGVTPRIMPDKDDAQTPHHQGGAGGAFLIGHSLGTCLTAHFLRHYPQYVSGTLSIDPISVLPYIPDLVREFLYEEPKTVGQLLVRVISREIGVATVIQRHFHWFEFVMFPHLDQARSPLGVSAAQHRHHFVLSEHDALVSHTHLQRYLAHAQPNCSFTTLAASPHAGFLFFYFAPVAQLTLQLINFHPLPPSPPPPSSPSSSASARKPLSQLAPTTPTCPSSIAHRASKPPRRRPASSSFRIQLSDSVRLNLLHPIWPSFSFDEHHMSIYWFSFIFFLLLALPS